jgi:hypothetical protein
MQPQANGVALFADDPAERRRMFLNLIQKNISEDQLRLLFGICDRYGFDPMLKHVILIQQGMYVTRDGMLQYAHRTGLFDGMEEVEKAQDKAGKWHVTVAVYRKGCARPFVTTAYQVEHENDKSTPWQKSPYRMTYKCAAVAALRMAFPVELGGAEEVGYDGVSARTNIGTATIIDAEVVAAEPPSDAPAPAKLKVEDWPDDRLLAAFGQGRAEVQVRRVARIYLGRAQERAELNRRWGAAIAAGCAQLIADELAEALAQRLRDLEPGAYQHHAREDKQPILGDTPDARLAMLERIRAAMAAAGKSEIEVNKFVSATWGQAAIETLNEAEAEELIAILQARGDDDDAPAETPARYPDDNDDIPF